MYDKNYFDVMKTQLMPFVRHDSSGRLALEETFAAITKLLDQRMDLCMRCGEVAALVTDRLSEAITATGYLPPKYTRVPLNMDPPTLNKKLVVIDGGKHDSHN